MTKLTRQEETKLVALYLKGVRTSALAERFGVKAYEITHTVLPRAGIKPRRGRPRG